MSKTIRMGTRGSRLALVQAAMVETALKGAHSGLKIETVAIKTSGDWKPEQGETRLSEAEGGKGLFAKEIEAALAAGEIDFAVHSLKDMPSVLPEGLALDHVLPREDARDALVCAGAYNSLEDLPRGARVGTSSVRRQALVLALRPDLLCVPLRGNVETRIEKMKGGQADAILLALAGLKRLGLDDMPGVHPISTQVLLPACGQGIIGLETRAADAATRKLLDSIHSPATGLCAAAERGALMALNGSCRTPVGAYATLAGDELRLRLCVAREDGSDQWKDERAETVTTAKQAAEMGHAAGMDLKSAVPPDILNI